MKPYRARTSQRWLLPTLPLKARDQLQAQPHFTPPWAPSWAQSAAPTAPAPNWVQLTRTEGPQQQPRVGWVEHQDPPGPFPTISALRASVSPHRRSSGSLTPPSDAPFAPACSTAAGRVQPSGDLHPTGKEGPGKGVLPLPGPPRCREASPR